MLTHGELQGGMCDEPFHLFHGLHWVMHFCVHNEVSSFAPVAHASCSMHQGQQQIRSMLMPMVT